MRQSAPPGDLEGDAALRAVDDHADRAGLARGWWGDVESLGEPGDQQGEFHLGECEADAVASASTEGNPRGIGGQSLIVGQVEETIGVEVQRVVPHVGVSAGQVRRPEDEGALGDRVPADLDVAGRFSRADHTGGVEAQRFVHDAAGDFESVERSVIDGIVVVAGCAEHFVGFGSQRFPNVGGQAAAPQHPRQRGGGGVEPGTDQCVHLVEDLAFGDRVVVHQHFQHVVGIIGRIPTDRDDGVSDEVIEGAAVGLDLTALSDRQRMRELFPGRPNLGEALRRISEGAAMIRSKGEAGTGNVVEAVRHLRSIIGDIKKITQADQAELFEWAKRLQAPLPLVQEIAETGKLQVPLFCAGGLATPADAALAMQLGAESVFVGSGIFKSEDPAPRAKAIVEATTHFNDPDILAKVSRGLGAPMTGIEMDDVNQRYADRGW